MTIQFDTKIALVLRSDLATWQALNVTAFLAGGLVAGAPEVIGEPYHDRHGTRYTPLVRQPVIVLACDAPTMRQIQSRAIARSLVLGAYVEGMFATGNDTANRAVFGTVGPEDEQTVGLALLGPKAVVDRVTKGATLHR